MHRDDRSLCLLGVRSPLSTAPLIQQLRSWRARVLALVLTWLPCPPSAADCFERVLGETRKGTVRRVLEVPLWAARRTLASIDG